MYEEKCPWKFQILIHYFISSTIKDLNSLEQPDTILQRKLLSKSDNSSKCSMYLELGIIPVKYVLMKKE